MTEQPAGQQPPPAPGYQQPPPGYPQYGPPRKGLHPVAIIGIIIGIGCVFIAVIGIFATISMPVLLSARDASIDEKGRNTLRTFVSANAAYYAQFGTYCDDTSELVSNGFLDARWSNITNVDYVMRWEYETDGQTYNATLTVSNSAATVYQANETGEITENP